MQTRFLKSRDDRGLYPKCFLLLGGGGGCFVNGEGIIVASPTRSSICPFSRYASIQIVYIKTVQDLRG